MRPSAAEPPGHPDDPPPGQVLAQVAECVYLGSLLLLPGIGFLVLAWLRFARHSDVPPLARCHIRQTYRASLVATVLMTATVGFILAEGGFITLAATLAVVPTIPVAGLALILGIDRFMSESRSLTNFVGNGVAAIVVSRWEGELDLAALKRELGG